MEVEHDLAGARVTQVPRSNKPAVLRMDLPCDWWLSDNCWFRYLTLLFLLFDYNWLASDIVTLSHTLRESGLLTNLYWISECVSPRIHRIGLSCRLHSYWWCHWALGHHHLVLLLIIFSSHFHCFGKIGHWASGWGACLVALHTAE